MTEKAVFDQLEQQKKALIEITNKATSSKEAAIKYLEDAGITRKMKEKQSARNSKTK